MTWRCLCTELSLHFTGRDGGSWWQTPGMTSINGEPATPEQLESLALVNYGHFTSLQVENGTVRGLSHHLDRVVNDCRTVFDAELDRTRVREYIRHEFLKAGRSSLGIRVTIFDPTLDMGKPSLPATPSVVVSVRPTVPAPLPHLRVKSASYTRDLPLVKHIGLFGALAQRRAAQVNGFDDVLFTDQSAFISEGPTWNIGFFDGERIICPSAETLPGVTMRLLTQVHDDTVAAPVNLRDVPHFTAAFATNVTIGIRPIAVIDNILLPDDEELFAALRKKYEEIPGETI
jgi:branched-subunit amino acid aminotransferase/4-amino-4-deoxychorismate lyase